MMRRNLFRCAVAVAAMFLLCAAIIAVAGLHDDIGHADVALVLGSKVEADGNPSPRLRARLDKTVELYRAGWFPEIIAGGGIGKEGFDEAAVMKAYLVAHGIPQEQVIVDNSAAPQLLPARAKPVRSFAIRNSAVFHIPRAKVALRRFGIVTVYAAHANFFEWRDIYSLLRELPGWVEYWFRRVD